VRIAAADLAPPPGVVEPHAWLADLGGEDWRAVDLGRLLAPFGSGTPAAFLATFDLLLLLEEMGLRFDVNVMPNCDSCVEHTRIEHERLWDSFRAVALAERARGEEGSLVGLRKAYFQAFHDRGHTKTEDWLEVDGELVG
jgi:hypothetical protein